MVIIDLLSQTDNICISFRKILMYVRSVYINPNQSYNSV